MFNPAITVSEVHEESPVSSKYSTKAKARVALFTKDFAGGGAERVMMHLARGLIDLGDLDVDIVVCKAVGPNLAFVPAQARVIDLGARQMVTSLMGLCAYIRQEKPAAILSALDHANITAIAARALIKSTSRLVISIHTNTSDAMRGKPTIKKRLELPFLKMLYPSADAIVAVSQGVADDLAMITGLPNRRINVIYNPVITDELFERSREPVEHPWLTPGAAPVILNIGRLTYQKDQRMLLKAFKKLRMDFPSRLLILGEGEDRADLEAYAGELGLRLGVDGDVLMPGYVPNPYAYMSRCAVLGLTSRYEGLPTVLIEALACGMTIVSTDCPSGPREILAGGKWGRLTPVGDSDEFVRSLKLALTEKRVVDTASWEPYKTETAAVAYRKLLRV